MNLTKDDNRFYDWKERFLVSVDCVILGFRGSEINLLAFKRKIAPNVGDLSLFGGFIHQNENLNDAAKRVVLELTGMDDLYMEQVGAYGNVDRDPGERVISVAYFALINMESYDKQPKKPEAFWINLSEREQLIFDHKQMVNDAIMLLRQRAELCPVGFNLLPERFTLPQLQSLYESIYGEPMDKRNFRKKILAMDILERLDEKDKLNSKRGAYYFVFNEKKYDQMLKQGFSFNL